MRRLRGLATFLACASAYGFAIGAGKNLLYAWRSAIKVPLLLSGTALICAFAYGVLAAFVGLRLSFASTQLAAAALFRTLAILLAALAPPTLFLARTMVRPANDDLGGYPGFVLANVAFVGAAGALALVHQARLLLRQHGVDRDRARILVGCWLALTLAVGGQLSFWLRPFFGIASLTGDPPFALGAAPTVTGARNFYEVVWQFLGGAIG